MKLRNIYIQVKGGLGNQLFQYALAKILSKKFGGKIFVVYNLFKNPRNTFRENKLSAMQIKFNNLDNTLKKISIFFHLFLFIQKIKEKKNFTYQTFNFKKKDIYLIGYWQCYKYFNEYKDYLYQLFFDGIKLDKNYQKYLQHFQCHNSIAVHVRRGDYITNKFANTYHGVLSKDYYQSSINFFNQTKKNAQYFIFSDDIEWCKKNFINHDFIFVDESHPNEIQEMKLMSMFSFFIIANSSFSWWPAFLSPSQDKKVVCPKTWNLIDEIFDDLLPKDWQRF